MSDPIAVVLRFDGDPDDLAERFELAHQAWLDAQDGDYVPPKVHLVCTRHEHRTGGPRARQIGTGIVVLTVWPTEAAHAAFTHRLRRHLDAVGLGMPDRLEHLNVSKLGWD
jgi:hypothetical protein